MVHRYNRELAILPVLIKLTTNDAAAAAAAAAVAECLAQEDPSQCLAGRLPGSMYRMCSDMFCQSHHACLETRCLHDDAIDYVEPLFVWHMSSPIQTNYLHYRAGLIIC